MTKPGGDSGLSERVDAAELFPEASETATSPESPAVPDHRGHRQRLRDRALRTGPEALADYELLELFLFRSLPQRDVKPLAKALLSRFGNLGAVCAAPLDSLVGIRVTPPGGKPLSIARETALDLKLLFEATRRIMAEPLRRETVISSWTALLAYVRTTLAHEPREQFRILFLDKKNQLIADELQAFGTIDHAPVYPREVVRRALEHGAAALILVHNHPSGDPMPSQGDIDMTKLIVDAARPLKISVHDHLVVGREGVASFKSLGLM